MSKNVGVAVHGDRLPAPARYAEEARPDDAGSDLEHSAAQTWLADRATLWQLVACRCQEEVSELTSALQRCRSSGESCRDETERALREAQIRLHGAREELARARQWAPAIAEAARVGRGEARRS